jgi:hypothetical protein
MMSILPPQPIGATSPKSGKTPPPLPVTLASLVFEVDVVEVVTSTVPVEVVVEDVVEDVEVGLFARLVPTSLLALPNGVPSGTAALQPTK